MNHRAAYLSVFGITASLPGAKATSLANALNSVDEAHTALWDAFATAVPTSDQKAVDENGYSYYFGASTTEEPSWFTDLPDSAQKELLQEESQIISVKEEYLATSTSSGVASQQTLAAVGGVLAAGFVGVAALL